MYSCYGKQQEGGRGEEEVLVNDVFVRSNFVHRYFGGVEIKLIMLTYVAVFEEV